MKCCKCGSNPSDGWETELTFVFVTSGLAESKTGPEIQFYASLCLSSTKTCFCVLHKVQISVSWWDFKQQYPERESVLMGATKTLDADGRLE